MSLRVGMRRFLVILAAIGSLLSILLVNLQERSGANRSWAMSFIQQQARIAQPQAKPGANFAIRIVFGLKDQESSDWSGGVNADGGEIVGIEGWHFGLNDKILDRNRWQCGTKQLPPRGRRLHPREFGAPWPYKVEPVGIVVLLNVKEHAKAKLSVNTSRGDFAVSVSDVAYGVKLSFLDGNAEVDRVPISFRLTDAGTEDDYPAIAYRRDGTVWVAWIAYQDQSDHVYVRVFKKQRWLGPVKVTRAKGDRFRVSLAEDEQGRMWVIWSERADGDWDLYGRWLRNETWSEVQRITKAAGTDAFHKMVSDRAGRIWLVWQSFRNGGQSDIYLKYLEGSGWSEDIRMSESSANDWEPSVAVNSSGEAWVVWDSYDKGNYDIFARSYANGRPGEVIQITKSPRFEAHADAAFDRDDRLWVAWDEAEANWGKDWGFLFEGAGNPLYRSRRLRVACVLNKRIREPKADIMDIIPEHLRRYCQLPRIQSDTEGRLWVFFRCRTSARIPQTAWAAGGKWEMLATYYHGDKWHDLIFLPNSVGRNDQRIVTTLDGGANVWAAWAADDRPYGGENPFGELPRNHDVFASMIEVEGVDPRPPALKPFEGSSEKVMLVHPEEEAHIARIRNYTIEIGGKRYRIYRGDMHRHTDISLDGSGDGSLLDFYRYSIDAARLDFAVTTDHHTSLQEYSWWRTVKAADLFLVPGAFTPLFGYERSLRYPNGHRNVVFAQRAQILPTAEGEQEAKINTGSVLYPYLKRNKGIAMSHTSATDMGTDWRDNDPDVEPLVEIFQGARNSYEYEGAPLAATQDNEYLQAGGFRKDGFVWKAWAKGYKLGVQASSDHISTHLSYSCILAEDGSREALLDAIRRRHAYAATDNIIVDFRANDPKVGTHIMGDTFATESAPRIWVRVIGTRRLKQIDLVKNNTFIYTLSPQASQCEFEFVDNKPSPGQSYYYVRVMQEDGQMAWSSPIWISYAEK